MVLFSLPFSSLLSFLSFIFSPFSELLANFISLPFFRVPNRNHISMLCSPLLPFTLYYSCFHLSCSLQSITRSGATLLNLLRLYLCTFLCFALLSQLFPPPPPPSSVSYNLSCAPSSPLLLFPWSILSLPHLYTLYGPSIVLSCQLHATMEYNDTETRITCPPED